MLKFVQKKGANNISQVRGKNNAGSDGKSKAMGPLPPQLSKASLQDEYLIGGRLRLKIRALDVVERDPDLALCEIV